jgi:hypothetical protein
MVKCNCGLGCPLHPGAACSNDGYARFLKCNRCRNALTAGRRAAKAQVVQEDRDRQARAELQRAVAPLKQDLACAIREKVRVADNLEHVVRVAKRPAVAGEFETPYMHITNADLDFARLVKGKLSDGLLERARMAASEAIKARVALLSDSVRFCFPRFCSSTFEKNWSPFMVQDREDRTAQRAGNLQSRLAIEMVYCGGHFKRPDGSYWEGDLVDRETGLFDERKVRGVGHPAHDTGGSIAGRVVLLFPEGLVEVREHLIQEIVDKERLDEAAAQEIREGPMFRHVVFFCPKGKVRLRERGKSVCFLGILFRTSQPRRLTRRSRRRSTRSASGMRRRTTTSRASTARTGTR